MGINTDEIDGKSVIKTLIDEGNSNTQFLRVYQLDEDGLIESFEDINYDNTSYVPIGPVKELTLTFDHGDLSGLSDDDHVQYLNEVRGDIRYYTKAQVDTEIDNDVAAHANLTNNPHNVTKAQVGLGSVDNTSDEDKPISTATQAALDLKADLTDLDNFETSTELDARDAANRDRSNHTGTQLANTISDFTPAVQAAETTTTLALASNILTYTNEDGVQTNIDLSLYLDDTNLARIVSGSLNPTTGIVTFTRDDSSTFDIDFSPLLDTQSANEVSVTPGNGLTATDVQAALDEHQTDINALEAEDTNLQNQINSNDTDILNLQNEQTTQNTNITNNANNIATNANNISSNDTDISNLQTEQTTQNNNISQNQTDISNLQASQSTQDAAIALNTAKVSADGSINTHSDVDTQTAPPVPGDQLEWNGTNWVPKSIDNGFTIFPIWAEENGNLSNNNAQWSFGNGSTGFIGIPLGINCELFAISLNADSPGASVSINVQRDGANIATPTFTSNNQVIAITAIPYTQGQLLSFQTNTAVGTWTDVRVCVWFRVKSTALFPTPDRSVVNNSAIAFTSTTFATIPGMSTTVTINDTGTVDGTFTYSAARSGGINSETQFRVVINGNNGQIFNDTLSTFNDTGAVSHFVQGLSAGTYTVLVQAAASQPITIAACQLSAVGVES